MEIDKEVCRRLYDYLCKTIGSEEVVNIRRRFYASVDYFTERSDYTLITSGSRSEGLEMGSDLDIMWLFKNVHISEEKTEDSFLIPNNIVMDTDECKPCFSQLKGHSCHFDTVLNWVLTPHGHELRLESGRMRYLLLSITRLFRPFNSHGPCVSDETNLGLCDLTVCLRCPVWINQVQPWIKRERYWPSTYLVSHICSYGILFVPIGSKDSPNEHLEWRISFSVAEKLMIFSFTHTQFLCYALMKLLLKKVIDKNQQYKGLLCSYFMKTVMFWVSEESHPSIWRPENIWPCFMKCLKRLVYCITYRYLPHYFIIENNLFECRFNQQHSDFLKFLKYLLSRGIYMFRNCYALSDFFYNAPLVAIMSEIEIVCCKLKAISLQISRPLILVFGVFTMFYSPVRQLSRGQLFITRFLKIASKDFMPFIVFAEFCQLVGKSMNIHTNCPNKLRYQLTKQYLPYLYIGLCGDAVSGWMYLATYYYCIGKYKVSLQLINHALRECTNDKLFYVNHKLTANRFSEFVKDGIRQKIWKLRHLYKNHVIHEISFYYNSRVIPPELDVQFTTGTYIPPLVYIQFLRFLCLYRLHEEFQCEQAIHDLLLSIDCQHFNCNESVFGEAYKCLAVAFAIYGKTEKARYYFDAYDLYKERWKDLYF
ncbi:Hypothetical predicted protein [Mytilus galloprovincialis]|uniref:Mab-21-like HhH/H2TH-like domain-containing protein n=1 Tax=Mytilus galloprovincialis TaxID=29158 RepID=A0A8B6EHI2_MYTGA|nr:Hypothetical predicted protein [Mytilus galloprovincialis]